MPWTWGVFEVAINILEACLDMYILASLFSARLDRPQKVPLILAILLFSGTLCVYTFGNFDWTFDFVPLAIITFSYLCLFRNGSWFIKLFWIFTINVVFVVIVFTTNNALTIVFEMDINDIYHQTDIRFISVTTAHVLYLLFTWILVRLFRHRREKLVLKRSYMLLFTILPLFGILLLVFLQRAQLESHSEPMENIVIMASVVILVFEMCTVILFDKLSKQAEETLTLRAEAYYNKLQTAHQEDVKALYEEVRLWRHDYKNHMGIMQSFLEKGLVKEALHYISQGIENLSDFDYIIVSGNAVVDAILSTKLTKARKNGIETECSIILPEELPFAERQLTILLGNLLDNSIEACARMKEGKKFINVSIAPANTLLSIEIKNSTAGEVIRENGVYKTLKTDKLLHGLGLRSVDAIVQSAGGYCERNHTNRIFSTSILLPLKTIDTIIDDSKNPFQDEEGFIAEK